MKTHQMTTIDFAPGMHGHFLSYVINQYIFDINVPIDNIFQRSGAAHAINIVPDFLAKRLCLHGHYSYFKYPYPAEVEKIIFIKHDPTLDFLLLTNIYHRCHPIAVTGKDMNIEEIQQLHINSMFSPNKTTKDLRNDWYAKLQERHLKKSEILQASTLPRYDFDFSAFFDPRKFVQELALCAEFLQHRLHFSSDLLDLHQSFLHINQGYQKWLLAQTTIDHILRNRAMIIDINDWQLHSYINHSLSNLFKIYDGSLWSDEIYPSNTETIYGIITDFLDHYDDFF